MRTLVLFDIDGTLLLSGGAGARALDRAFSALHGVEGAMEGIRLGGKTDPAIVREMFRQRLDRAPSAAELSTLFDAYLPLLTEEVAASPGFVVMPGIESLLGRLAQRADLLVGLVTGNLEPAARIKLARPGFNHHFRFGGFGSDSEDRDRLTQLGVERGRAIAERADPRVVVVGDTPHDVQAARHVGAYSIAVATGMTPYDALAAAAPDLLLRDLADPSPLLAALDAS